MFDRLQPGLESLNQRFKGGVVKEDMVFRVIHDVVELLVEQPGIGGVQNAAHADDAEPCGQVTVVVHRERRDAIPRSNTHSFERLGHAPGIVGEALPVGPDGATVGARGNNLPRAMLTFRMIHQPHDPQRPVLHRAQS